LSDLDVKYNTETLTLKNDFEISFGRTKLGDESFRTNNNEINIE